jgi:hypothetical protein
MEHSKFLVSVFKDRTWVIVNRLVYSIYFSNWTHIISYMLVLNTYLRHVSVQAHHPLGYVEYIDLKVHGMGSFKIKVNSWTGF